MKLPLVLVDSSYFITLLRMGTDPLTTLAELEFDYEFAINGVIWAEVVRGRSDPRLRERYDLAFSATRCLELDAGGWQTAVRLAWDLDRRGTVLPLTDLIIAASALRHGAQVLTFDRHFSQVPGLQVVSHLE